MVICALSRRPVCELESFAEVGIAVPTSLWQGIARCTIYICSRLADECVMGEVKEDVEGAELVRVVDSMRGGMGLIAGYSGCACPPRILTAP